MQRYIFFRLFLMLPTTVFFITLITFTLGYYGPGDPIKTIMGQHWSDQAQYLRLRHAYGLDQPYVAQYLGYLQRMVLHLDFGTAISQGGQPVGPLMAADLSVTMQLAAVAVLILLVLGIGLGVLCATWPNGAIDRVILSIALLLSSIPVYVLIPMSLILFVLVLHVLPGALGWEGIFSKKAILPALTLALGTLVVIVRQTRASIIEVLTNDYIRTARAKGLSGRLIVLRHVLRNALTPVLTNLGLAVGGLITGSVFVETAFGIPGFGNLFVQGLNSFDYAILVATTTVSALIIMLTNLVVDLLYAVLDPRVRYR